MCCPTKRLVVAFPARGPRITDMRSRRGAIRSWRRGVGQINRVQVLVSVLEMDIRTHQCGTYGLGL